MKRNISVSFSQFLTDPGDQTRHMSRLGWLVGFFKHDMWAAFFYFLYTQFPSSCKILVWLQTIWCFSSEACWVNRDLSRQLSKFCHVPWVVCPVVFLWSPCWPGSHKSLVLKKVLMLYLFTVHLNFSETPLAYGMDIKQSGLTLLFRGIYIFNLSNAQ